MASKNIDVSQTLYKHSDSVPALVSERLRWALPRLICGNMCLLLVGHMGTCSTLQMQGYAPGDALQPGEKSRDNIITTAKSMAEADAWLAVFAVAIMSGIWPYMKMILTQWTVSRAQMGELSAQKSCERLRVLETLGKWSYADLNLVAINLLIFDISTDEYRVLAFFKLKLDFFMQLHYGAFALTFAIIFSTLITYWALHDISRSSFAGTHTDDGTAISATEDASEQQPLLDKSSGLEAWQRWEPIESLVAGLLAFGCLWFGALLPFLTVTREGFLGNLIRKDQTRAMSILSVPAQLTDLADVRDQPLVRLWAIFFLAINFVFPMLEASLLAASMLLSSCCEKYSRRLRAWSETAHSFGCVDVLLAAVLITLLQLKLVVNYNLSAECEELERIYQGGPMLTVSGLGMAADKDCFRPVSQLGPGFWLLLLHVVFRSHTYQIRSGYSLTKLFL